MILVFTCEINNNNRKRKAFVIHWADYLHVNPVLWIINQCMKVFINHSHLINHTIHLRRLVVVRPQMKNIDRISSLFFSPLLASSVPADSLGHNEMNESTTGTLLSLGKTEFDRRIKKKYVSFRFKVTYKSNTPLLFH